MVDVYVVMVEDRHTDPEPHIFADESVALEHARALASDWLDEAEPLGDRLFYAEHPSESDTIWVVRRPVNGALS